MQTPATLEAIDIDWLRHVTGAGHRLADFDVESLSDGVGFLGLTGRVRLRYLDAVAGPASIVVKLRRRAPDTDDMAQYWDAWSREAAFYRDLAADVVVRVPAALYIIDEPGDFALVLEDGAPAVVGDQVAGAREGEAEAAVDAIAGMHATWWGSPRLREPAVHRESTTARIVGDRFATSLPQLRTRFAGRVPERSFDTIDWFAERVADWRATVDFGPATLIHTDFRLDNLLFHPDGGVIFVDWQLFGPGRGPRDIANFLSTNLEPDDRRAVERDILERWRAAVAERGVETPSGDELWAEYVAWVLVSTLTYAVTVTSLNDTNDRGRALFDAMLIRGLTAVDDLDARTVVEGQLRS